jgi:hypothetical protein
MPTSINWPAITQYADVDNYQEAPERNLAEFQPEVGPPKRRRRTNVATVLYDFTVTMKSADYDTLIAFYRDTLLDGSLTFNRNLPRDPTGTQGTFEFMFTSAPMYKAIIPGGINSANPDGYGQVQMSMRKMP